MRIIYLPTAPEGTVVGRPIKTAAGTVLVAAGKALSRRDIESLVRCGVTHVYAFDQRNPDIEPVDVVDAELRESAGTVVRQCMESIIKARPGQDAGIEAVALQKMAGELVDSLGGTRGLILDLLSMFDASDYLFNHSVNCAILAVMAGNEYGLNSSELTRLGLGMLLHDLGMIRVHKDVYDKPGPLTAPEWNIVQRHPREGSMMALHSDVSPLAANLILRHHECWDGSGYPGGIAGDEIPPLARIAATVEVYDSMTSPRPYAPPLLPHQAASWILRNAGVRFEPRSVAALLRHVAIYPAGLVVELNTGESGLAVKTEPGDPTRPTVRLMFDARGRKLDPPVDINLRSEPDRFIAEAYFDFSMLRDARLKHAGRAA